MKSKFDREVYLALQAAGHSNRQIARFLDVDESAVRRALRNHTPLPRAQQYLVTVTPVD